MSETFDKNHHKYVGEDGLCAECKICGQCYIAEIHTSFEKFSRECDEVFG